MRAVVPDYSRRDSGSVVSSKNISQVLLDLQSSNSLISISVAGLSGTYLSMLLKVDTQNDILLFDGLQSPHLDHVIEAGAVVSVSAKLGANNIEFDCIIEASFALNKAPAFKAHVPVSLRITERRNAYRVRIPAAMSSSLIQLTTDNGPYQGRLIDISRQGAAALLPIKINTIVGNKVTCAIHLMDTQLDTHADIRSASTQQDGQRLGLLFTDLSSIEHKRIDTSIATLERIILRDYVRLRAR
ncbi:MAG: flagellar regulator YcgR PilZN domain-containing protein [Pseudomonadota bacterium]